VNEIRNRMLVCKVRGPKSRLREIGRPTHTWEDILLEMGHIHTGWEYVDFIQLVSGRV
jgi:hypothetical protein